MNLGMTTLRTILQRVPSKKQLSSTLGVLKAKASGLRDRHLEKHVTRAIGSLARRVADALEEGIRVETLMLRTTVSNSRQIHVWDVATGKLLHRVELPLKEIGDGEEFVAAHEGAVRSILGRNANLKYSKDSYHGGYIWVGL